MTTPDPPGGDPLPERGTGGGLSSYPRRVARRLGGGGSSEIVASDPIVGGGDNPDAPLIPGWHVARAGLRVLARWLRDAWAASVRWAGRRWRSRRGRLLLAGLLVLVLAVPTGLGFGLAAVLRDKSAAGGVASPRVLRIGVMAPLSGDLGNIGISVRNAVTMAVDEVNKTAAIPGWKVEIVTKDDLSRPDGGSAAAGTFTADTSMVGVIGPLSSTVAQVALPVLAAAGLPVVSPSNSAPALTGQDDPAGSRTRPYPRYFRLSGTDALEARTGADYAVHTLHRKKILIVDGGSAGETLAERFAADATADGAEVVATYQVNGASAADTDVQAVTGGIETIRPDLVYTTTGYSFASEVRKRLADDDLTTPILGTDAMLSARYLDAAGVAGEGDLATDLAVPLSRLPAAGAFAAAYVRRWGVQPGGPEQPASPDRTSSPPAPAASASTRTPGATASAQVSIPPQPAASAFVGTGTAVPITGDEPAPVSAGQADMIPALAAYAYDAARALLRAVAAVMPGRTVVDDAARAAVAARIGRASFAGVTGQVAFDPYGDRADSRSVIYAVRNGRFVPIVVTG